VRYRSFITPLLLLVTACVDISQDLATAGDGGSGPEQALDAAVPSGDAGTPPFVDAGDDPPDPQQDPEAWCAHLAPGPAGTGPILSSFAQAHAASRHFGPHPDPLAVDRALSLVLAAPDAVLRPQLSPTLERYAISRQGVCALPASPGDLPPAAVVVIDDGIAVLRPGPGEFTIPPDARAIALDLRDLPDSPELWTHLEAATRAILSGPLPREQVRLRTFFGRPRENGLERVYSAAIELQRRTPLPGAAAQSKPLAVLVGPRTPPAATELAGLLRLGRRAHLIGSDLYTEVAEARWTGVGPFGLAYRVRELSYGGDRWPDVIPADVSTSDPLAPLPLLDLGAPVPPLVRGPAARPQFERVHTIMNVDLEDSRGAARASLLVAHGAIQFFHPHYRASAERLDEHLEQAMANLGAPVVDPLVTQQALNLLGSALPDTSSKARREGLSQGQIPLRLDWLDGKIVVRRSEVPGIEVGDVISAIDEISSDEWLAQAILRSPGASLEARRTTALIDLPSRGARRLEVSSADGTRHAVLAEPAEEVPETFEHLHNRPHGPLTDLGAPGVYYLNLTPELLPDLSDMTSVILGQQSAAGLVLDLRNGQLNAPYYTERWVMHRPFSTSIFRVPQYSGPDRQTLLDAQNEILPTTVRYQAPIVILTGPRTRATGETFLTMVAGENNITTIGRRSAGENGDITIVATPSGLYFTFRCMDVLFPDGRPFTGIGVQPDLQIEPNLEDLRRGRDVELAAALQWIQR